MKENDALETRLQTLPPRAVPAAWREEILARAVTTARSVPPRRGPPRWLALTWGAGIAATVALHLLRLPLDESGTPPPRNESSFASFQERARVVETWLARQDLASAYPNR